MKTSTISEYTHEEIQNISRKLEQLNDSMMGFAVDQAKTSISLEHLETHVEKLDAKLDRLTESFNNGENAQGNLSLLTTKGKMLFGVVATAIATIVSTIANYFN